MIILRSRQFYCKMLVRNLRFDRFSSRFLQSIYRQYTSTSGNAQIDIEYKDVNRDKYQQIIQQNLRKGDEKEFWKKVDNVLKFYEYKKYTAGYVPSDISVSQMEDLMKMTGEREWESYLRYVFLTESRKARDKLKKAAKAKKNEEFQKEARVEGREFGVFNSKNEILYGLWNNSLFARITDSVVSRQRTVMKLRQASLYGQPLIIDLDYDDHMRLSEARIQVRHIVSTLVTNLHSPDPFDIFFTNCDSTKPTMKELNSKYMQSTPFQQMSYERHFLRDSYLNHFPKDRLVYLSPDAPKTLNVIDPNDIYIVGGFLDKSCLNKPVSHTKAKRDGIRQYRLPLDENLIWGPGSSKHLCIMHIVGILNEIRLNPNWKEVLHKHVPKRKVKDTEVVLKENEARRIAQIKRKLSIHNAHSPKAL